MADVVEWSQGSRSRGVSTTLGYVLNLGVATLLVTALLLSAGTLVEDQRERASRVELRVVGEQVAADLATADRLARASNGGSVRFDVDAPARVTGSAYEIRINESGDDHVTVAAENPDVEVSVPFEAGTNVPATTRDGGEFTVVYDDGWVVDDE